MANETNEATVDFVCNICGKENLAVLLRFAENREYQSCIHCRSSLRMRSLIYVLSKELFGKALLLPEFPVDKTITGLGMSDWTGYADVLTRKLSYVNTFYHTKPRLDITDLSGHALGQQRFLISSDVFEHIPPLAIERAFQNSRKLLQENGFFILTVPFAKTGETKEHFPDLFDFEIVEQGGKRILRNKTRDGRTEVFDDLVFHGGDGMTLEMRLFSEPDLVEHLKNAGFSSVEVCAGHVPEFGILWPMDWAVPIVARC